MTTDDKERQQWLDFAHTVDVLASSSLAAADLAQTPPVLAPERAAQAAGTVRVSFARRKVVGSILLAACLLLVAVPVARLVDLDEIIGGTRPTGDAARPIALQLSLAKTSYQPGEPLSFKLESNTDCHPLVYSIGADNQVRLFDPTTPNTPTGESRLKADNPLQVPVSPAQGAGLTAAAPGSYTIGALCSSEDLSATGASANELRERARQGRSSFESYLAGKADRDRLGTAQTTYDVR